ncbi:MAG: chemotaxis protein CheX [Myxococcota bacterium]
MLSENDAVSARVGALAAESCLELFEAYSFPLTQIESSFDALDETVLSGVMGFVGTRLRGTCLLTSTAGPLEASCPTGNRARDWIGELTNQLVGRLKTKLIARGVEVFMTTPIVLTGARIRPVPRGMLQPTVFSSSKGGVMVWVEAESGRDLTLSSEAPAQDTGEGDILIF